jgi:hypothetical protein
MRIQILLIALGVVLSVPPSGGTPGMPQPGYWRAKLDVVSYDFTVATEEAPGKPRVTFNVANVVHDTYDLYQNPRGVVRRELTFLGRSRVIEPPLDFALFNYDTGYVVAWDKGGGRGERSYFGPPIAPSEVGMRQILGHSCKGYEYDWQEPGVGHEQRTQWIATDAGFREPLIDTLYVFDKPGVLSYIELRVVTRLDPVGQLPESMFTPPPSIPVVDVGR